MRKWRTFGIHSHKTTNIISWKSLHNVINHTLFMYGEVHFNVTTSVPCIPCGGRGCRCLWECTKLLIVHRNWCNSIRGSKRSQTLTGNGGGNSSEHFVILFFFSKMYFTIIVAIQTGGRCWADCKIRMFSLIFLYVQYRTVLNNSHGSYPGDVKFAKFDGSKYGTGTYPRVNWTIMKCSSTVLSKYFIHGCEFLVY